MGQHARLPTGVGHNYLSLAKFLNEGRVWSLSDPSIEANDVIALYPLGNPGLQKTPQTQSGQEASSEDEEGMEVINEHQHFRRQRAIYFRDRTALYRHSLGQGPQSRIIFLSGFMPAEWINHLGARYLVDPEFFGRHLSFRYASENLGNYSIPRLPSSSRQFIELPVITLGRRLSVPQDSIRKLRERGRQRLSQHHNILIAGGPSMKAGQQMVRDYYLLDEVNFAIEEQISIYIQVDKKRETFNCKCF